MTDQEIDFIISARNFITDRIESDEVDQHTAEIDALLREVAPGTRNDVDRLLGRSCATPTPRADYGLSAAEVADIEARCNEQASDAPQHEGMWM